MEDKKNKPWTIKDVRWLLRLKRQGKSTAEIGATLGRSKDSISNKLRIHSTASPVRVSAIERYEQLHRAQLEPRDLTAALCGDPLPGYSALDRRGGR